MKKPGKGSIVVSGIQPSGKLHLGNYFGAIRQHIEFHDQHESLDSAWSQYLDQDFHQCSVSLARLELVRVSLAMNVKLSGPV